ncbi:HET-domain-containing protein [Xylaria sp. FL0043]|nr:HET-domain-containing protein [Xylaria sp. FL0043]
MRNSASHTMSLCSRCEKRWPSYSLAPFKNETCEFCPLLYQGLTSVLSPLIPDNRNNAVLYQFPPPPDSSPKGKRGPLVVTMMSHRAVVSYWCSWGTTCPWGILPAHRDITPICYEGEGSFQTALQWIEDCTTHHRCSDVAAPTSLPARVIDTALSGGPIRLVEGAPRKGRYVCLSHCWGQERPLTTTSQTLRSHMEEISWDCIPATFQDAINVCRKLRIRYIWIDSLCIIQDSLEDWERESSKMADIYRNSYVTIAAASSKDSRGGLSLDKSRRAQTTLKGTTSTGKSYSIHVQCSIMPHFYRDEKTPKEAIQHPISPTTARDYAGVLKVFPLLTRGWVLQERLLSPRFLQFGKDELLWDCRESMLCECGQRPADLPYNQFTLTGDNHDLLSYRWRKIVEFYCCLSLTFPQDRLPALSGLARQMGERKAGATYLAGLWSDSLELDLLWIPYGPESGAIDEYIAPSWSWAHVGRKIIYRNVWLPDEEQPGAKTIATYFELVEASCTPSSADPTGKVSGGTLVLKSPLYTISVYDPSDSRSGFAEFRHGDTLFSPCTDSDINSILSNWRLPFDPTRRRVFLDYPETYRRFIGRKTLYACRLTRIEISERSIYFLVPGARETLHVEFSLLLERVGFGDGCDVFKRVGLLADGRFIEGHRGDGESWNKDPSCFDSTAEQVRFSII